MQFKIQNIKYELMQTWNRETQNAKKPLLPAITCQPVAVSLDFSSTPISQNCGNCWSSRT